MILDSPEWMLGMFESHDRFFDPRIVRGPCKDLQIFQSTELDVKGMVTNGFHDPDGYKYVRIGVFYGRDLTMLYDR